MVELARSPLQASAKRWLQCSLTALGIWIVLRPEALHRQPHHQAAFAGGSIIRGSQQERNSRHTLHAEKSDVYSWQTIVKENEEMERKAENLRNAMEQACFVPGDFDEAVDLALESFAAFNKDLPEQWQMMVLNSEDDADEAASEALEFSFQLGAVMAERGVASAVTILVPGEELVSFCRENWDPLPQGLDVRAIPEDEASTLPGDSEVFIIISPEEVDVPGLARVSQLASSSEKAARVVLINPILMDDVYTQAVGLATTPSTTFHMTRIGSHFLREGLNEAVVMRAWPSPFTIWEDNPEDPAAVDGYFLMGLREEPPTRPHISMLLEGSAKKFKDRKWGRR